MKITGIQFFYHSFNRQISETEFEEVKSYSANIVVDNKFIIQASGNAQEANYSIPPASENCWGDEEAQQWAYKNIDLQELIEVLEFEGLENNFHWLFENADEHY